MKVAVISFGNMDFLNHKKDSENEYFPAWSYGMTFGLRVDRIETTQNAKKPSDFVKIESALKLRLNARLDTGRNINIQQKESREPYGISKKS